MDANFFSFSDAISLFRKNLPNSFGTGVMGTASVDRRTCEDSLHGPGRMEEGGELVRGEITAILIIPITASQMRLSLVCVWMSGWACVWLGMCVGIRYTL